jgi:23S rRNA C2498 (ribose-2'-O)-methylase RlmM
MILSNLFKIFPWTNLITATQRKWIKDIIQHLIDTERIFSYRAMRISRNDKTPLASFDEDDYINNTNANERNLQGLLTEMALVRQSTIALLKVFQKDNYLELAGYNPVSFLRVFFYASTRCIIKNISRKVFISYSEKWTKFYFVLKTLQAGRIGDA